MTPDPEHRRLGTPPPRPPPGSSLGAGHPGGAHPGADAEARGVTWLGVWVNVGLGAAKVLAGWLGGSRALLADGLHSLTDLASDAAVLAGLAVAARPADDTHPYGHHKATSLVTLGIAASVLAFAVVLVVDALRGLESGDLRVPHPLSLVVALVSLAIKELLYRRTLRVARAQGSRLLMANAWHHRTDSASSFLAAAGIAAVLILGPAWAFLDAVAAAVVAGWIGLEGLRLFRGAVDDLMDGAPEREIIDDLREHILPVEGALAYHDFRVRRAGDRLEVDFHLLVEPHLTIDEGHRIAHRVKEAILRRHPEVLNLLIHVEPALPEHHRTRGIADGILDPSELTSPGAPDPPPLDAPEEGP
jgi:cation diffusion facilitator family transporter